MTTTKMIGESRGVMRLLRNGAISLGLMMVSAHALADNVLQDVRYAAAPGGKVDITLQFSQPVGEVQAFTTDAPPRIAIDLPNTTSALAKRRVVVGSGATSAVSAAEAGGRTRVVVDLLRPAGYVTRSSGNLLVITVDAGVAATTTGSAMIQTVDPSKRAPSTLHVSNIDFRRGDNGAGRVILRFDGAGAATDMRNDGKQVLVDVSNAQIPENLRRRLDVTDFATPVVSVEPRANAGGSRLVINTNGAYDSMAYQTGNEYVVEITPKRGSVIAATGPGVSRAAGQVTTIGGPQRYVGKPVTFNFQDVPVRTVLQLIAEESNLNIVVADTVSGSVTLRLINVPWDQALEILLRAKGLDQRRDGNVVWVAPQAELSAYELAQNTARINLENSGEIVVEYIPINYGSAQDLVTILNSGGQAGGGGGGAGGAGASRGFLSSRGSVSADVRTNTLLLSDTRKKIDEIRRMLEVLDRPVDQVLIEARIVIADETFGRELGARFGVSNPNENNGSTSNISGNLEANLSTINSINTANNANANLAPGATPTVATITRGLITDLAVPGAAGSIAFSILRSSHLLDVELSALQQEGRGEVVSHPRVITTNQREATITQGDEVGYTTPQAAGAGQALATPAFKEALLELKVTPTITTDGRVFMQVAIKKDDIKGFTLGVPSLTKRSITTGVMVDSGDTVVIGGVYEFRNREDVTKVPWIGDIPILGNLFKKKGKSHAKAELLVFVTPRVLQVSKR
ncbi:MAG: type IV pilus secretin PilQ [Arenimonas sp.]|jgi:type IV pilus assembly protein PilQ